MAISFAGEDRPFAEGLASLMRESGFHVFYDKYESVTLWGKDLYQHLSDIYQKWALLRDVPLSKHYRDKLWTKHEQRAAQARAFTESREYILPIRLDDTELPAVLDTIAYVDIRTVTIEEIAQLLKAKIRSTGA